jgi:hypothetical protein
VSVFMLLLRDQLREIWFYYECLITACWGSGFLELGCTRRVLQCAGIALLWVDLASAGRGAVQFYQHLA